MQINYQIPSHLPQKLTISFWLWNYFSGAGKGDCFHNLEARIVELKERCFNTIRIDAGIGLCYTPEGKPRGEITLHEPFAGYSSIVRQMNCKGGECDVLEKLIELFELAKKHDVYVILSSWFYLHTFWFVSDQINKDMFSLPVEDRLMYMATEFSWLIDRLKEKGLDSQIAFIEIANESDGAPFDFYCSAYPGEANEQQQGYRKQHETALAFLQEKYPDLLFACDTCNSKVPVDLLPGNIQLWNHHMYYMWDLYFNSYEVDIRKSDFDFQNPEKYPSISKFLRETPGAIDEIRQSAGNNPDIYENWYRRIWLYNNTDSTKLVELDKWYTELLVHNVNTYKKAAERGINRAVEIRNQYFPNMPLVIGEAVSYCTHIGLRWEEHSDEYWKLLEYTTHLANKANYWGYTPRTHSGPEDPAWTECADRFKYLNRLFLDIP